MNNIKINDLQLDNLFEELSEEDSAIVVGGGLFSTNYADLNFANRSLVSNEGDHSLTKLPLQQTAGQNSQK